MTSRSREGAQHEISHTQQNENRLLLRTQKINFSFNETNFAGKKKEEQITMILI